MRTFWFYGNFLRKASHLLLLTPVQYCCLYWALSGGAGLSLPAAHTSTTTTSANVQFALDEIKCRPNN